MRPTALRSGVEISFCARAVLRIGLTLCALIAPSTMVCGEEPDWSLPTVVADSEPTATVTTTWQAAEAISEPDVSDPIAESILTQPEPTTKPADESTNGANASSESPKPDAVNSPPSDPKLVQIDGAGDVAEKVLTEFDEPDSLYSGYSVRWLVPRDGFGITNLELGSVDHRPRFSDHVRFNFGIPFGFGFVDEPQAFGVPSVLYSPQIESRVVVPLGDGFGADVSVIPGWFSDFDAGKNNGFRVTGHGIGTLKVSDELQLALGAMYLGRDDVHILPAGGVVWSMSPDTRLELLMPKPRLYQKIYTKGGTDHFAYTGFELWGGNTWAVTRPDDSYDRFTYRDFRFLVGWEYRGPEHARGVLELGYVFARKLEFRNSPETQHPGGTFLLRLGSSY